jgi:DNA-binding NarL/FixJ family response regulator
MVQTAISDADGAGDMDGIQTDHRTQCGIDVVLADRDALARGVIGTSLVDAGDFNVLAQTASGHEAVELCARLHPAVAVLEINLRDIDGVEATRRIVASVPDTHVLILSAAPVGEFWLGALNAGARGILAKEAPLDMVVDSVREVARGEPVIPASVTALLIERVRTIPAIQRGLRPVQSKLSEREWEVVALLRDGASTADVADELQLSEETVYTHLKHIRRKLGVHSRAEAVAAADALLQGTLLGR